MKDAIIKLRKALTCLRANNKKFELYTDASQYAAGAVLKQGQNIIAYYGKSWSEQESKQHILNLEAKALYLAIRKFQYELTLYSKEPKTIIYNDNRNLVNILNKKELPLHKMIANIF
jgi:RNase H-like domain found in reverse transcriptase